MKQCPLCKMYYNKFSPHMEQMHPLSWREGMSDIETAAEIMHRRQQQDLIELRAEVEQAYEQCALIAETEPEPEGPMPVEFNRENISDIVRGTVRATRKCIADRIRRAALEKEE